MRTPTLLFSAGFVIFLITSLLQTDQFDLPSRLGKQEASFVVKTREAVANVVTQAGGVVSKRITVGLLTNVAVYPGVRLVHDPAAGNDIILTGPQRMIDLLHYDKVSTELYLDFTRPIVATQYLTVAMDLGGHGDYPHVQLANTLSSRSDFPPILVTPTPIRARGLKLTATDGVGSLLVETEELDISDMNVPDLLGGTTKFLLTKDLEGKGPNIPGLTVTGGVYPRVRETSER